MASETGPLSPLEETLRRIDGTVVTIKVKADKHRDDDEEADRVHRLLLRKKRSGPLGLGD